MTARPQKKLQSKTGASLALALLLFVACSFVGVVIVAAATVAVGASSQRVELDQRYYSVTSAVTLLRGRFDKQQVHLHAELWENTTGSVVTADAAPLYAPRLDVSGEAGEYLRLHTVRILNQEAAAGRDEDWALLPGEVVRGEADPGPYEKNTTLDYTLTAFSSDGAAVAEAQQRALNVVARVSNTAKGMTVAVQSGTQEDEYRYTLTMSLSADVLKNVVRTPIYQPVYDPWLDMVVDKLVGFKRDVDYTVTWQVVEVTA